MKPLRTWVVVVDGGHAKFLHFAGRKTGARTIPGHVYARPAKRTHELGRDKPPSVTQSKSPARHAIQPRVDLHEIEEERFLKDIVRNLELAFEADAFDELVLLAPPKALGILRKMIPRCIQDKVIREADSDYTEYDDAEITRVVIALLEAEGRKTA